MCGTASSSGPRRMPMPGARARIKDARVCGARGNNSSKPPITTIDPSLFCSHDVDGSFHSLKTVQVDGAAVAITHARSSHDRTESYLFFFLRLDTAAGGPTGLSIPFFLSLKTLEKGFCGMGLAGGCLGHF
ncbi:hypothetical protein pdul_cds_952 [Pandoravirus dulcis]|uniref:Uncharacterized protein n=1 Tax=Pandoravirus dulcis TaxID=1349409 RepID=A0A291AU75_9VIRU|nr:hypothetical protein pdul_cds_952 [Pandoravirus dulcis]ATE82572.1 hypothetical protein pdul_cds_952 [Pandoravirus dulcis]